MTIYSTKDYILGMGLHNPQKKGEEMEQNMNDVKLNVLALAALKKESIKELAERCDIDYSHLRLVSCGSAKMTADDLLKLAKGTGISPFNIDIT